MVEMDTEYLPSDIMWSLSDDVNEYGLGKSPEDVFLLDIF